MEYKICPICDQKMTKPHYCDHCRQRIRNPLTIDVNYYLNERHPDTEHDCSFHDYNDPAYNMQQETWQPSRQTMSDQSAGQTAPNQTARQVVPNQPRRTASNRPARQVVPNQPRKAATVKKSFGSGERAALLISIIIIFVVATAIISVFFSLFSAMQMRTPDGGALSFYPSEDSFGGFLEQLTLGTDEDYEEGNYENRELDEADVIAAGVNCNSYGHFHVTKEEMADELLAFLADMGYSVESEDTFTSNTEDSYGYTSFNRYDSFYFNSRTSMEIHSDTATGQLHSVNISWTGADKTIQIAEKIIAIFRDSGDWSLSEADTAAWLDDLKNRLAKLEYEDVTPEELSHSVYVFVSSYESDGYYISFSNWGN